MDYNILIRPLIGAGIGYITNWIAVKMMFRPLKPIKIGKFTLPFTPGIIPKNKPRLAETIGNTISKDLLTDEDFKNVLLSDSVKSEIKEKIINYLNGISEKDCSLEEFICTHIEKEDFNRAISNIEKLITNKIYNSVIEANLAGLIAEQIEIAAKEKLKGSMLGMLGGNAIISSFTSTISTKLDEYLNSNGEELVSSIVKKEISSYATKPVSEVMAKLSDSGIDFVSFVMNIYEKVVTEQISNLLKCINISQIVTDKINKMDVLELEKILLLIMKKELNALVNLGALIGFVLGFFNLLF
ncbi:MAG: DUF445 family protein [Clostridia bacterium]|nr:DUF445 family protein [Clostridia bacterium]